MRTMTCGATSLYKHRGEMRARDTEFACILHWFIGNTVSRKGALSKRFSSPTSIHFINIYTHRYTWIGQTCGFYRQDFCSWSQEYSSTEKWTGIEGVPDKKSRNLERWARKINVKLFFFIFNEYLWNLLIVWPQLTSITCMRVIKKEEAHI